MCAIGAVRCSLSMSYYTATSFDDYEAYWNRQTGRQTCRQTCVFSFGHGIQIQANIIKLWGPYVVHCGPKFMHLFIFDHI